MIMKMIKILLHSSLILSICQCYGQLSNSSASIYDIQTINGATFISVGEKGCIRKTDDAGKTWRLINSGITADIYSISMVSDKVSYACGKAGVIKSSDGGESWEYLGDPTWERDEDIFFLDENNGFVLSAQGYISKTNDGGNTWIECTRPWSLTGTGSGYFSNIFFFDMNNGYATYQDNVEQFHQLFKTTNGGKSWSNTGYEFRSIVFPEKKMGYAIKGINTISKTTDNGRTWIDIKLNIYDKLTKLCFVDGKRGYAITIWGSIYYTKDGAVTWTLVESFGITLNGISAVKNSENVIAVGENASILLSDNSGINWSLRCLCPPINLDVTSPFFINEKVGFVFCQGFMNKTLDGGVTWYPYSLGFDDYIFDSYFLNEQLGFLVTENGLYKTEDGGANWIKLSFYNQNIKHIYFIDKNVGFIFGDWCTLYKTNDGGANWVKKRLPYISQGLIGVSSMQFVNNSVGYLVGDEDNDVCKTEDGGETWVTNSKQPSGHDIFFLNDSIGFTGRVSLNKTTDGGKSWEKIQFQEIIPSIVSELIIDIHFIDEQKGFILTDYDHIFYTQTGGSTWTTLKYGKFNSGIKELGAYGDSTLIGVGSTGFIFKMLFNKNEKVIISDNTTTNKTFKTLNAYEVYPNPVKDILYVMPSLQNQEIEYKLFSINGQLLLQNKAYFTGTPIIVEIPRFYKGVALLQIIGKNGSHTKKIVIQ